MGQGTHSQLYMPYFCTSDLDKLPNKESRLSSKSNSFSAVQYAGLVAAVVVLLVIFFLVIFWLRRKALKKKQLSRNSRPRR